MSKKIPVTTESAGLRLDRFLSTLDFISSRSRAAELIDQGRVLSGGKPLKASSKVSDGQVLEIDLPEPQPSSLVPLDQPLDILFEDSDVLVLNKPAGLVVHPAAGHAQDTLVNILLHHVRELSMGFSENRPGIVHRLDRGTSGILVVAKNDLAHHHLAKQFKEKTVHRVYWAIAHGKSPVKERTITSRLARHPQDRKRFASQAVGKLAITHYKVLQTLNADYTWIECRLETGRTHQIRVHLSEAGLPLVGDQTYGGKAKAKLLTKKYAKDFPRVALHACELGFIHPRSGEKLFFKVDWPKELLDLSEALGFKNV